MFQLAFLLIGANAFRSRWYVLALLGAGLIGLAAVLAADISRSVVLFAQSALGIVLLTNGLVTLLRAATGESQHPRLTLIKGGLLIILSLLVAAASFYSPVALAAILGFVLLADGLLRIIAPFLGGFPGWRFVLVCGLVESAAGPMVAFGWPLPYDRLLTLCVALLTALLGLGLIRLGMMFRTLPPEFSILNLPIFAGRGWYAHAPILVGEDDPVEAPLPPIIVHVWTPTGAAVEPARRPLLDRYIMAVDKDGVISTGHAAIEVAPDMYMSHYPAVEVEQPRDGLRDTRAALQKDQPGKFHPSYAYDVDWWCPANLHIELPVYNPRRLLAFWLGYQQDSTYNLANRNCSTLVAAALDSALEGTLAARRPWLRLVSLLLNPDVWVAALIRNRASAMTWTPGMILDYSRTLVRLTTRGQQSWLGRFGRFVRRVRVFGDAGRKEAQA
jgi:uncharacterized membrane protein HdeD (DUF308 family)